jgi:ADP-ribose pyrophosphatase
VSKPNIPIPDIRKTEIAYHGYFDVAVDHLKLPHGPERLYTVLKLGAHAAAVIALTTEGKLVMTREYRHPPREWLMSCPGGRIDPGESPIEAGRRELLEETGYGGGEFSVLGTVFPFPAVTDQQIFYVLANGVSYLQAPALDPFELIHVELHTLEDIFARIKAQEPVDGVFCTGLFLFGNRR